MNSGPENYTEALKLIAESRTIGGDDLSPVQLLDVMLREAQIRATLALAAATALRPAEDNAATAADWAAWYHAATVHPAVE